MAEVAATPQKWPTPAWALGELKIYAVAVLASGTLFLLATGLLFSPGWTLVALGLLASGAIGGAIVLNLGEPWRRSAAFPWPVTLRPVNAPPSIDETDSRAAGSPNDLDDFGDDLQKLLDSAERIAAENETLRLDLAQLRKRALRRRANLTS